jgi:hypothetical protein
MILSLSGSGFVAGCWLQMVDLFVNIIAQMVDFCAQSSTEYGEKP